MKKFQEMCQEEFEKIELMARGGQKIVFDGVHNSYGETVIKLTYCATSNKLYKNL